MCCHDEGGAPLQTPKAGKTHLIGVRDSFVAHQNEDLEPDRSQVADRSTLFTVCMSVDRGAAVTELAARTVWSREGSGYAFRSSRPTTVAGACAAVMTWTAGRLCAHMQVSGCLRHVRH